MTNGTRRTVHVAVYDTLADWEVGHAVAHLRDAAYRRTPDSVFDIATVGPTAEVVTTMGGLRVLPDTTTDRLRPEDSAMLILPGAHQWLTGDDLSPFSQVARRFLDAGVPVAAICGATAGLAREGLLDHRRHTSAVAEYLAHQPGYSGHDHYVDAPAVTDGNLITAGPTEPVAFAREILARLDAYEPEVLDAWYRLFEDSDAAAFPVLMAASGR